MTERRGSESAVKARVMLRRPGGIGVVSGPQLTQWSHGMWLWVKTETPRLTTRNEQNRLPGSQPTLVWGSGF